MSRHACDGVAAGRRLGLLLAGILMALASALPAAAQATPATAPPAAQAAVSWTAASTPAGTERTTQATPQAGGIDWARDWTYGARGAVTLLTETSLETGVGFSAFAVLPLTTDLEFEGEIGYQTMSTVSDGLPAGRQSMFPLRATLRVQLWRFRGAKPYAGGGAGLYFSRFGMDDAVEAELATLGFAGSATVDPGLILHAAGGVEWQRDRFHFGVDVKYLLGNTDAVSTIVDQVTEQVFRETSEISFDGFWIAAGARFSF